MTNAADSPEQRELGPDAAALARDEDKRQIRMVGHDHVTAWCASHGTAAPGRTDWQNCQDVLTFLRHCEWADGGNPTTAQIARGCSGRGRRRMSERTAQRAIGAAERLGLLFSAGQGRAASNRTILYARLREMVAAVAEAAARVAPAGHSTRQTDPSEAGNWRVDGGLLAGRKDENGGSIPIPDLDLTLPTTTSSPHGQSSGDEWREVEGEIFAEGVTKTREAIDIARRRGVTVDDVRAVLAYFRLHRAGWRSPLGALFCRLSVMTPGVTADSEWPEFSEDYQGRLNSDKRRRARDERIAETVRHHQQVAAERAEYAATAPSLTELARKIDADLARGIELARRRQDAAKNRFVGDRNQWPRPP